VVPGDHDAFDENEGCHGAVGDHAVPGSAPVDAVPAAGVGDAADSGSAVEEGSAAELRPEEGRRWAVGGEVEGARASCAARIPSELGVGS
jgi:hypothetical protein